jgi:hypothetical protein
MQIHSDDNLPNNDVLELTAMATIPEQTEPLVRELPPGQRRLRGVSHGRSTYCIFLFIYVFIYSHSTRSVPLLHVLEQLNARDSVVVSNNT